MYQQKTDRLEAEAWEVVGLSPPSRLVRQQPQYYTGPVNVSNVTVANSAVGVLNTGSLSIVGSSIGALNDAGMDEVAAAISEITTAVVKASELDMAQKNELLELVSAIASESALPAEQRRKSVLKILIRAFGGAIGTAAALITIWEKVQPILAALP